MHATNFVSLPMLPLGLLDLPICSNELERLKLLGIKDLGLDMGPLVKGHKPVLKVDGGAT